MPGYRDGLQPLVHRHVMAMIPSWSIGPSIWDGTRCAACKKAVQVLPTVKVGPAPPASGPNEPAHLQGADRGWGLIPEVVGGFRRRQIRGGHGQASATSALS